MRILSLLSEEVFDFGRDQLTSQRAHVMMTSLNEQFQQIYDLCMFVIQNSVSSPGSVTQSLLTATLQCVVHFLKWVPYGYIFETGLIDILMGYFWDPTQYRIDCVRCLTEITSLRDIPPEGLGKLGTALWCPLTQKLSQLSDTTLQYDVRCVAQSRLFWETFYAQLALCLTSLLRYHRVDVCEVYPNPKHGTQLVVFSLEFLNKMTSKIAHEETFKICVDYWHSLAECLLNDVRASHRATQALNMSNAADAGPLLLLGGEQPAQNGIPLNGIIPAPLENPEMFSEKLREYQPVFNAVRRTLILKMARPREVCIRYDEETGTVDRDYETDTDEVALYNVMRETLVFLTNLGGKEMQEVMMDLLKTLTEDAKNPNQRSWNPTVLSRLCWALGSISGAMSVERERAFLVHIIRELLWLCEHKRGKENKAIVASMIMYVFGQYPRFLKSYVRFLETVVSKLFEFMHESFGGVQEMACETFLKISQRCAKALATPPEDQKIQVPLVQGILPQLPDLYMQLQTPNKQLMLYEGAGHIVAAAPTVQDQEMYIRQLCAPFATSWTQILLEFVAATSRGEGPLPAELFQPQVARKLTEIVRVSERIASATGTSFSPQLMSMYQEMLRVYNIYSSRISEEVASHGPVIMTHTHIKALRSVKRASLLLVQSFVESATTRPPPGGAEPFAVCEQVAQFIVPPLLQPVLEDYRSNVPQARDHEVLSLLATLVTRLHHHVLPELPRIFEFVFDCTLDMIKTDFHSFPDHRTRFYDLLRACTDHCFEGLFTLPDTQQRYYIESLVWALKHEQPAVADQGLTIMQGLLKRLATTNQEILLPFSRVFYWRILREVLGVLTDTLHKSGFQLQTLILMHLVQLVELERVNDPESRITKPDVMAHVAELLLKNFSNLNPSQVEVFVLGLFNKSGMPREFSQHIRDFLVQLKEFAGSSELFEGERQAALESARELQQRRQMQVPGMMPQYTAAEQTRPEDLE